MKIKKTLILLCFLVILTLGTLTAAVTVYPTVNYVVGNATFTVSHPMIFNQVAMTNGMIKFNNTIFQITTAAPIAVTLHRLYQNIPGAAVGTEVVAFNATGSGAVAFKLYGFVTNAYYNVYREGVFLIKVQADGSGAISFTNSVWDTLKHFSVKVQSVNPGQTYLYAAGAGPRRVWQFLSTDMTKTAVEGPAQSNDIYGMTTDGTYLYYVALTPAVYKVWMSNLTVKATGTSANSQATCICYDGTYLYITGSGGFVEKFDPATMAKITTGDQVLWTTPYSIAVSDQYVIAGETNGWMSKYNKNTMVYQAHVNYGGNPWSISPGDNTYFYVGGETSNKVTKYRWSDLAKIGDFPNYGGTVGAVLWDGQYVYAGGLGGVIRQYWPGNFTQRDYSTAYGGGAQIWALVYDGSYIYAAGEGTQVISRYSRLDLNHISDSSPAYGGDIYGICSYLYPSVDTLPAQNIQEYSAKLAGYLNRDMGLPCKVRFEWGEPPDLGNPTSETSLTQGHTFYFDVVTLSPGLVYNYRAVVNASGALYYGGTTYFLSKPCGPTGLTSYMGETGIVLSWTHGVGYTQTVIRRQLGSYPATPQSGTPVYNDTGTSTLDLCPPGTWYYRAWEYTLNGGYSAFSPTYASVTGTFIGAPTVTIQDPTAITKTTATLHATLTDLGGESKVTVRFTYWASSTPGVIWNTTNQTFTGPGAFSAALVNLNPGTRYSFLAWANNTHHGAVSTTGSFYTKPLRPSKFNATWTTPTHLLIQWEKGFGANNTLIRYAYGGPYPATVTTGTVAYNGTGTSVNLTLNPYQHPYLIAWSINRYGSGPWLFSEENTPLCLLIQGNTTYVEETTAYYNYYAIHSGTVYASERYGDTANTQTILQNQTLGGTTVGGAFGSLTQGHLYYIRVFGNDSAGNTTISNRAWFVTKPEAPTLVSSTILPGNQLTVTWTKGDGAQKTVLVKKVNSYPTAPWDGTVVYNNTGTSTTLTFTQGERYYLKAWSYSSYVPVHGSNTFKFSDGFFNFTKGGIIVNVKDETNYTNLTFGILITNPDGSQTYTKTNCHNPLIINSTDCPHGPEIRIIINATKHNSRTYTIPIYANTWYSLDAFLPLYIEPGDPGYNENETYGQLCVFQVNNLLGEPAPDAVINVKKYIDAGGHYYNVTILSTDSSGTASTYLIPGGLGYKIVIDKEGYVEEVSDVIVNEQIQVYTFKLTPIYYPPDIWQYVDFTVEPYIHDWTHAFTIYYNITANTYDLEYYSLTIYKYNTATTNWDVSYTLNITLPSTGTSMSHVITVAGHYCVQITFKLEGYDAYTLGGPLDPAMIPYILTGSTGGGNNPDDIINNAAGQSPVWVGAVVASWTGLGVLLFVTYILFTFSPKFAGLGVIGSGLLLGFCKGTLGIISDSVINWSVVGVVVILGVMVLAYYRNKPTLGG